MHNRRQAASGSALGGPSPGCRGRSCPGPDRVFGVDFWGGYARKERLDAGAASHRLPELASLIEQHARDHATSQAANRLFMAQANDLNDFEIPF